MSASKSQPSQHHAQQWEAPRQLAVPTGFTTEEPAAGPESARLAVVGNPVEHSKSPQLHLAAYRALALEWAYSRWQIEPGGLANALGKRAQGWRGLSVTAPFKAEALAFAATLDPFAERTGAVNTLVFDGLDAAATATGYNTDVYGILAALAESGCTKAATVDVIGAGETAASAAVAALELGATRIRVVARRPEAAATLVSALETRTGSSGVLTAADLATWSLAEAPELLIDTVPGGVPAPDRIAPSLAGMTLLSAAYDPWPTALAEAVAEHGGTVVSGELMLLHQAIRQVRLFSGRDADAELPNEASIVDEMRAALRG